MKRSAVSAAPKTAESISTSFLLPPSNRARAALVPEEVSHWSRNVNLVAHWSSSRPMRALVPEEDPVALRRAVPHPHPTTIVFKHSTVMLAFYQ